MRSAARLEDTPPALRAESGAAGTIDEAERPAIAPFVQEAVRAWLEKHAK